MESKWTSDVEKVEIKCKKCGSWIKTIYRDKLGNFLFSTFSSEYVDGKPVCLSCLEEEYGNNDYKD